jgi:nucleotide-binding universal stress UspA family protein
MPLQILLPLHTYPDGNSPARAAHATLVAAYLEGELETLELAAVFPHDHAEIQGGGRPIADVLQDEAARIGTGVLVMGGFGHSRMREFVLGRATRGTLENLRMPVLMAH